jgi:hypothetical protein
MFAALLVLAGVGFLVAAGFGVDKPRFKPQWFGFACLGLAACWPILHVLSTLPR